MIRILLIDDSRADRGLFMAMMQAPRRPWLRDDVQIDARERPLDHLKDYDAYDGVILDWRIGVVDGLGIARQLHHRNPFQPIVLLTGSDAHSIPADVYDYCWWYSTKPKFSADHVDEDMLGVARALVRACAALKCRRPTEK